MQLDNTMSEIETLESEMMEILSELHNLSGKRLEKARLTLAEICAEYEIQIADLEIELNVTARSRISTSKLLCTGKANQTVCVHKHTDYRATQANVTGEQS